MVVLLLAATISIDIDLSRLLSNYLQRQPKVVCGIKTVGYRFTGPQGRTFRYAGDTYVMPAEGWIELLADSRRTTYLVDGKSLPIGDTPHDQFGFRTVVLPDLQKKGDAH